MNQRISVFIVDDSAYMRRLLTDFLEKDPGLQVIGFCPQWARSAGKNSAVETASRPPGCGNAGVGRTATLAQLFKIYPVPVVMFSALTTEGAEAPCGRWNWRGRIRAQTVQQSSKWAQPLNSTLPLPIQPSRLKGRGRSEDNQGFGPSSRRSRCREVVAPPEAVGRDKPAELVAIGTSTGGPTALQTVLTSLPVAECPPCADRAAHAAGVLPNRWLDG
jgi:two-component system chemotaxis response regulator CheB